MTTERRVMMKDVIAAGFCAKGARTWLRGRGFDVADFVRNGLSQAELEATKDEFANRVLARMRADG